MPSVQCELETHNRCYGERRFGKRDPTVRLRTEFVFDNVLPPALPGGAAFSCGLAYDASPDGARRLPGGHAKERGMSRNTRFIVGMVATIIVAVFGPTLAAIILTLMLGRFDSGALQWFLLVAFFAGGIFLTIKWAARPAEPRKSAGNSNLPA